MVFKRRRKPLWRYKRVYAYVRACWGLEIDYNEKLHGKSYTIVTDRRHRLWLYKRWQQYLLDRIQECAIDQDDQLKYWFNAMARNRTIAVRKLKRHNTYMERLRAHTVLIQNPR